MKDVSKSDRYDEMDRVVTAMLKGQNNATKISRELGIPRARVEEYMLEWRQIAANDENIKQRAKGAVLTANQHYDHLIESLYENAEEQKQAGDWKGRTSTLTAIANIEKERTNALRNSGVLDDSVIAQQLVEAEDKLDKMRKLLTELASKNPTIKEQIREGLKSIFGKGPAIVEKPGDDS